MVHIKIAKGLDIPISGKPVGPIKDLVLGGEASSLRVPSRVALSLSSFDDVKLRLLVKVGDVVKKGQALAEDKSTPGRMFVSPAGGVVHDVSRGLKRSLQEIVIDVAKDEGYCEFPIMDIGRASRQEIVDRLLEGGAFAFIRSRPFNLLADPSKPPRNIFVKAIESAPFVPPAELQVLGHEKEFQAGLRALSKLTEGAVHLVYRKDSTLAAFTKAEHVQKHTAEGPHPISNVSLHIQKIDPVRSVEDIIWTLSALDVVAIGHLLTRGRCYSERVVSVAGPGVLPDRTGYFRVRAGYPIEAFVAGRVAKGRLRLISGDPLMGQKVDVDDFLGFSHTTFCVIPEGVEREFLHFFGLGINKYSFSRAYLSGHLDNDGRQYPFTTSQHGEHRAFVDSTLYDEVMPLSVPTMLLVKAVMAEDFELAQTLGLAEVDSEDFALPTFVCPSKMEMVDIIKKGLKQFAQEVLV